jgi:hypothetical protein
VEEGNFFRYRLRDPSDFEQDSFRTITLGNAGGKARGPKIQAVVGKLKGEDAMTLQTYMFPTAEWDEDDASKWVAEHKDDRKSLPGSTLALPHKPHQYMAGPDGKCKVCGKAEDDPLHEEAAKRLSRPLKTLFEEELAQISPSVWTLQSARDNVLSDIAAAKLVEGVAGTPVDVQGKVTECMTEYAARFIPLAVAQINDWVEDQSEPGSDSYNSGRFYLRSINIHSLADLINDDATKAVGVPALRLADHSARTVSAVEEFATITTRLTGAVKGFLQRVSDRMEFRRNQPTTKSGRVLSKENSDRLRELHASLGSAIDDAKEMHGHLGDLIERANSRYTSDSDGDEGSKKALADEWETRLMVLNAEVDTELALAGTH